MYVIIWYKYPLHNKKLGNFIRSIFKYYLTVIYNSCSKFKMQSPELGGVDGTTDF